MSVARSFTLRASSSGWNAKVELIQSPSVREPGELEGVGEAPALPDAHLLLERDVEKLQVAHLLALRAQAGTDAPHHGGGQKGLSTYGAGLRVRC